MFSLNQISPFLPSLLRSHTVFPSHDFSHSHSTAMFVFSSLLFPVDIFSLAPRRKLPFEFRKISSSDALRHFANWITRRDRLRGWQRRRVAAEPFSRALLRPFTRQRWRVKNRLHTFASSDRGELSNLSVGE